MSKKKSKRLKIVPPDASVEHILPLTVGDPATLDTADLAIDQEHLEEYTQSDDGPPEVMYGRPPKGTYITVRPEPGKPWQNRGLYFVLELRDRDPLIVAPDIAKLKMEDEDVLRALLIVRYVTMAGEEGLWPVKLNPPDGKSNSWNTSAMNALKEAEKGWVRLITGKGHYRFKKSRQTLTDMPPKFSSRTFRELVNLKFPTEQSVRTLDHEIWDVLDNGSDK